MEKITGAQLPIDLREELDQLQSLQTEGNKSDQDMV